MVSIKFTLSAILSIIAGLLILIWPKAIRLALGFYLLAVGIINLIDF